MSYQEKKEKIDLLQKEINAFGELKPEIKNKINYKFRLDWNYYSNSIEGNTLTQAETRSVMIGNITVGGKPIKDVLEMKGHDEVITEILKIAKGELRISEKRICEIHQSIMYEEDESKRNKIGKWKSENNYILNYKGERFDFVSPFEVPSKMHDLLNKTNAQIDSIFQNKNLIDAIDIASQFHIAFVSIHPFYDGNGRMARILTNLLLIAFGYPPFWVKNSERDIYNRYLADVQGYGGSPDLFYEFIADKILRSQQLMLDAIAGKNIEEEDDLDKEMALLKANLKGEEVYSIKATSANIADALEYNIIPICKFIEDKCSELKEYFLDYDKSVSFRLNIPTILNQLGTKGDNSGNLITHWINNEIRIRKATIKEFNFSYVLLCLIKTNNTDSFFTVVNILFSDYYYEMKIKDKSKTLSNFKIPYEKKLSEQEISDIAKPIIKHLLSSISNAIQLKE